MSQRYLALIAAALLVACGKKAPETVPTPTDGSQTPPPPPSSTGGATNPGGTTTRPTDSDAAGTTADLTRILAQPIYFDLDQDAIKADAQGNLDQKAAIMIANPAVRVRISGHADERGSDEYNIVLGNRRATAAKRYLEAKGIDGSRIETISYGEERPVDSASSEEAWAKNRRDEFEITAGGSRLVKPQ